MAIFTNRVLLRCLNENALIVSRERLHDWGQRLDDIRDDYAATEWEIVLVNRLSKLGTVEYERPERGRIDLVFSASDVGASFAADIVTISDQQLHKNNPIGRFWEELSRRVRHVRFGGFAFHVGEKRQPIHLGSGNKRSLLLPAKPRDRDRLIFNEAFGTFLQFVKRSPGSSREYHAVSPGVDVRIAYLPGKYGVFQGQHGSYTGTTVIDNNPLFNALKGKTQKRQLKRCNFDGPKGIIVCDGGCRMLDEPLSHHSTYSVRQVVGEFLRQHKSVDFVAVIAIKSEWPSTSGHSYRYALKIFVHPGNEVLEGRLRGVLEKVIRDLPRLEMTPENAIQRLKFSKATGRDIAHGGGWQVSGRTIRISARSLLDLMAGKLSQDRFVKEHSLGGGNFFELHLKRGELITKALVEHRPDEDDDWIVFEFGPPDVAAASFKKALSQVDKKR